jgi:hypothetical protein
VSAAEPAYHLLLEPAEAAIAARALHLLIGDEAHAGDIRALARAVLGLLGESGGAGEEEGAAPDGARRGQAMSGATITVPLTPQQMKITHTAVKLLLDDSQRDQEDERRLLWAILDRLPDEHSIRAIEIA